MNRLRAMRKERGNRMGVTETGLVVVQAVRDVVSGVSSMVKLSKMGRTVAAGELAKAKVKLDYAIASARGQAHADLVQENLMHLKRVMDQFDSYNPTGRAAILMWDQIETLTDSLRRNVEDFSRGII